MKTNSVSVILPLKLAEDVKLLRQFNNLCKFRNIEITSRLIGDGSYISVRCLFEDKFDEFSATVKQCMKPITKLFEENKYGNRTN